MNVNESIINTALLGTANREFTPDGFPEALAKAFPLLQGQAGNTEETFYRFASLVFAYQQAGIEPPVTQNLEPIGEAPEEEKSYFPAEAGELLVSLHTDRSRYLLLYAYRQAARCNRLIPPRYLPELLNRAFEKNNPTKYEEQTLLARLSGQRGRWLLPQMGLPTWNSAETTDWSTASHTERKEWLSHLRETNPEEGLRLLQTDLKNDSAQHREDLIQCLAIGLNKGDEAFLEEIATTDRSNGVKEKARQLLRSMPDSKLVTTYCELLRDKLHYHTLFGWSYDKLDYTPEMKQLDLEEVSSNKKEKDELFLLRQLAERVPLSFWTVFYNCTPEKAAEKLTRKPPFAPFFHVQLPITLFQDRQWAYYTLLTQAEEENIISLMGLLTPEQREDIDFQPTRQHTYLPASWFHPCTNETWGIKFSGRVLQRILQSPYYTRDTAEQLALCFHPDIKEELEGHINLQQEPAQASTGFCRQILEYMTQKEKIDILFNDHHK